MEGIVAVSGRSLGDAPLAELGKLDSSKHEGVPGLWAERRQLGVCMYVQE